MRASVGEYLDDVVSGLKAGRSLLTSRRREIYQLFVMRRNKDA